MVHPIINLVWLTFVEFAALTGLLVIFGLILGLLEKRSNDYMMSAFGMKGVLATAWLGTPVHELGHAIMCLLFGHKIVDIKFLQTPGADGTLGYVAHRYDPQSLYQRIGNFFIGIAPLLSGGLAIFACMYFLVPRSFDAIRDYFSLKTMTIPLSAPRNWPIVIHSVASVFKNVFTAENLPRPSFWLFLFLALCISSHMSLSKADIHGALSGVSALYLFLLLVNVIVYFSHLSSYGQMMLLIGKYNIYILALMSITVLFSFITLGLSYLLFRLVRR